MFKKLSSELTAEDIATYTGAELWHNSNQIITEVCPLESVSKQGICFANNTKLLKIIKNKVLPSAIIVDSVENVPKDLACSILIHTKPQQALIKAIELFSSKVTSNGQICQSATISSSAKIGKNVQINSNVVISDDVVIGDNTIIGSNSVMYPGVIIGDNCEIYSNVSIREYCQIGNHVLLQNGCVIGADGFGYFTTDEGIKPVPQIGNVVLEDFVDIGANTCIDRATAGSTRIGFGTKIDNLVQIGHNVQIGKFTIVCGQVGIGGSTKIGDQCLFAGASKIKDHVNIVSGVRLTGNSTILSHITKPGDYAGFPAVPHKQWQKEQISLRRSIKKLVEK